MLGSFTFQNIKFMWNIKFKYLVYHYTIFVMIEKFIITPTPQNNQNIIDKNV